MTDTMRNQVASQVGELIWESQVGGGQAAIVVRRDSLAVVLAVAEACVSSHHGSAGANAGLLEALADLRAALPPSAAPAEGK